MIAGTSTLAMKCCCLLYRHHRQWTSCRMLWHRKQCHQSSYHIGLLAKVSWLCFHCIFDEGILRTSCSKHVSCMCMRAWQLKHAWHVILQLLEACKDCLHIPSLRQLTCMHLTRTCTRLCQYIFYMHTTVCNQDPQITDVNDEPSKWWLHGNVADRVLCTTVVHIPQLPGLLRTQVVSTGQLSVALVQYCTAKCMEHACAVFM